MRAFLCKIFGCNKSVSQAVTRDQIIAALGGEPLLKQADPVHDAAGLDKVISEIRS